jgi:NAD(P)-dependent dehydrogenase (short-subunit alcohol dehydrogenase family)
VADERTILVTGATSGLGGALATELAPRTGRLLVHGRNEEKGRALVDELSALDGAGEIEFLQADLASLDQVRALADRVEQAPRLDVLVNNAGVGTGGGREESADGHELIFAVNYLAPYVLTHALLPLLKSSTPARIVNVASIGQAPLDFNDLMLERSYSGPQAYAQSKLALIMLTIDLAEELEGSGVTANSLHPGTYMPTQMVRDAGVEPIDSLETGVESTTHLIEGRDLEGVSGRFFDRLQESSPLDQALDPAARKTLREVSENLTREDAG